MVQDLPLKQQLKYPPELPGELQSSRGRVRP